MAETVFTEKIRALRKQAGYTQEEVSKKLHIQRQTYSNYENASRNPPMDIIIELAELYHVSVDSLVRDIAKVPEHRVSSRPNPEQTQFVAEFSTLSGSKRKEVLEFIRFKKQIPD